MKTKNTDADPRFRSLLYKAVRRGNAELILTTSAMISQRWPEQKSALRDRVAVISLQECWPLGKALVFNRRFHSKVAALVRVAGVEKNREAAGLAYLGYLLSRGDRSVLLGDEQDRDIQIIAGAMIRPDDFWKWIETQSAAEECQQFLNQVSRFKGSGHARGRAVVAAAAYLAARMKIEQPGSAPLEMEPFPYWIVFDRHTTQGRRVLRDIARDLHVPLPQLEWNLFYFEGAKTHGEVGSFWWDRYCRWRFDSIGIPMPEAHLLWEPVRPQVEGALAEDAKGLHREIYQWKMEHLSLVDELRHQVEVFNENIDGVRTDQLEIFT